MNSYATNEGSNTKMSGHCAGKIGLYCLFGFLLLVSTAVLIAFMAVYIPKIYTENYAVVIDAGSTGSRAYLYKWKDYSDEKNDVVTEFSSCKAGKLQTLVWTDPNNGLVACIANVIADIPTSFLSRPYIYLASTAGMRLYQMSSPNETEIMFKNIAAVFQRKHWPSKYVGIISGEVEGISAWITANVLKNKMGKGIQRQETIGALDLGGSSTQITYETMASSEKITLYDEEYRIYAKSYLCYGANMFTLKYMTYVAIMPNETAFSCLLANTPVILQDDVPVCRYPGSTALNFSTVAKKVKTNVTECKRQVHSLVNSELNFVKAPQNTKFVAMSSYYYVFEFLKKYYKIEQDLQQFENSVAKFCLEDYNTLVSKFGEDYQYARPYCVTGMYILKLFKEFGISDLKNLEFADKIQGQNVGWNLGYMIDQTKSIPAAFIHRLNTSLFIAIIVIFTIVFVVSVVSLVVLTCARNKKVDDLSP